MKKYIIMLIRRIVWKIQGCLYMHFYSIKNDNAKSLLLDSKTKILCLVPHADDELIGFYNFIDSNRSNVTLFYFGFTGGYSNLYEIRKQEFILFCERNNIKYIFSSNNYFESLKNTIMNGNYGCIFTPNIIDWHKEHYETNYILYETLISFQHINDIVIYSYSISVPTEIHHSLYYIKAIKSKQAKKWQEFNEVYKSQSNIPVSRFILNERINGKLIGSFSAELFIKHTLKEWLSLFVKLKYEKNNMHILESMINNIVSVRTAARKIYMQLYENTMIKTGGE